VGEQPHDRGVVRSFGGCVEETIVGRPSHLREATTEAGVTHASVRMRWPDSGHVQVGAGDVIAEIVSLDTVWVEVPIFERDLPRLARPIRAVFSAPAVPGKELSGRLVDLGAVVDSATRAALLVFELPNRDGALRIGLQIDARLDAGERVDVTVIPREAVLESEGKRFVYVLRSGEEFERREVTPGDEQGATIAIVSGLKPGERVVTQGAWQVRQQELRPTGGGAHTHE
jgi:cobalt-zinc-cadmium efflux system membrane fusion protein